MQSIAGILDNEILICSVISWAVAQVLKILVYWLVEHRWSWQRVFGSGGMPSSHTSFVVSLAVMIGAIHGFDSVYFAISFALMSVVMYDATGIRREAGTQATVINRIIRDLLINGKKISDEELKELVGHTPLEVFAGALLGLIVSGLFLL